MTPSEVLNASNVFVGEDPKREKLTAIYPIMEYGLADKKISSGMGALFSLCEHVELNYDQLISLHQTFSEGDAGLTYAVLRAYDIGYSPLSTLKTMVETKDYSSIDQEKLWSFINAVLPSIGRDLAVH